MRAFGHDDEIGKHYGQGPVAGGSTQDHGHYRNLPLEIGGQLQVSRRYRVALRAAAGSFSGAVQQQHQGQSLFLRQPHQPGPLGGIGMADGAALDGEVFGYGHHGASLNLAAAANQPITRRRRRAAGMVSPRQGADFVEGSGVEQGRQPLSGSEPVTAVLTGDLVLATHGLRCLLPFPQLLQQWLPIRSVTFHPFLRVWPAYGAKLLLRPLNHWLWRGVIL